MLGNLLGQTGLEKPRLHSQGVHACWLAHQSGQRDLRVAELPNPKGQTLWLHPLHTTTWSRICPGGPDMSLGAVLALGKWEGKTGDLALVSITSPLASNEPFCASVVQEVS